MRQWYLCYNLFVLRYILKNILTGNFQNLYFSFEFTSGKMLLYNVSNGFVMLLNDCSVSRKYFWLLSIPVCPRYVHRAGRLQYISLPCSTIFSCACTANVCRRKSKRLDFLRYPNLNKIQTFSKKEENSDDLYQKRFGFYSFIVCSSFQIKRIL